MGKGNVYNMQCLNTVPGTMPVRGVLTVFMPTFFELVLIRDVLAEVAANLLGADV